MQRGVLIEVSHVTITGRLNRTVEEGTDDVRVTANRCQVQRGTVDRRKRLFLNVSMLKKLLNNLEVPFVSSEVQRSPVIETAMIHVGN